MAPAEKATYGEMVVCGRCGEPKGPVPWHSLEASQLCSCASEEGRRAQRPWGGDFNAAVELCNCCGAVALSSGSRWSPLLCDRCFARVRTLNEVAGRCVVPVGRHSLMNGVSLPLGDYENDAVFTAFSDQLGVFFEQSIEFRQRARKVVIANLELLGFEAGHDVRLDGYLRAAVRSRKLSSKSAFQSLLASLFTPVTEQSEATLDALAAAIEACRSSFRRGVKPSAEDVQQARQLWSDALAGTAP